MKKAFDANVSRAKPRVRLGTLLGAEGAEANGLQSETVEALAQAVMAEPHPGVDLASAIRNKAARGAFRATASEALQQALAAPETNPAGAFATSAHETPMAAASAPAVETVRAPEPPLAPAETQALAAPQAVARPSVAEAVARPVAVAELRAPVAHVDAPATVTEVQAAPRPSMEPDADPGERRERLKERLKAVRENPRPEPLPETVAEAGVLAVERISALQSELTKARAMNLALAQDLEAARRQAERATEEARVRMDEARRLSTEMEGRAKLLSELEGELDSLEGERNEALLAVQEARHAIEANEVEKQELRAALAQKDLVIEQSLAEEERLAGELEDAQDAGTALRRSADALKNERDTLARQVSDLTRERAELLEARKALEAVHRALAHAAAR